MKSIHNRGLKGVWLALLLSLAVDVVLILISVAVYALAPVSRIARVLNQIGSPVEELVNWIAPGHTGVQPLLDMLFSVIVIWALTWIVLILFILLGAVRSSFNTKPEST